MKRVAREKNNMAVQKKNKKIKSTGSIKLGKRKNISAGNDDKISRRSDRLIARKKETTVIDEVKNLDNCDKDVRTLCNDSKTQRKQLVTSANHRLYSPRRKSVQFYTDEIKAFTLVEKKNGQRKRNGKKKAWYGKRSNSYLVDYKGENYKVFVINKFKKTHTDALLLCKILKNIGFTPILVEESCSREKLEKEFKAVKNQSTIIFFLGCEFDKSASFHEDEISYKKLAKMFRFESDAPVVIFSNVWLVPSCTPNVSPLKISGIPGQFHGFCQDLIFLKGVSRPLFNKLEESHSLGYAELGDDKYIYRGIIHQC